MHRPGRGLRAVIVHILANLRARSLLAASRVSFALSLHMPARQSEPQMLRCVAGGTDNRLWEYGRDGEQMYTRSCTHATRPQVHGDMHARSHVHSYIRSCTHTCTPTQMYRCTHVDTFMHAHMHARTTHRCTHDHARASHVHARTTHARMYTVHTFMHAHRTHARTHRCTRAHARTTHTCTRERANRQCHCCSARGVTLTLDVILRDCSISCIVVF